MCNSRKYLPLLESFQPGDDRISLIRWASDLPSHFSKLGFKSQDCSALFEATSTTPLAAATMPHFPASTHEANRSSTGSQKTYVDKWGKVKKRSAPNASRTPHITAAWTRGSPSSKEENDKLAKSRAENKLKWSQYAANKAAESFRIASPLSTAAEPDDDIRSDSTLDLVQETIQNKEIDLIDWDQEKRVNGGIPASHIDQWRQAARTRSATNSCASPVETISTDLLHGLEVGEDNLMSFPVLTPYN